MSEENNSNIQKLHKNELMCVIERSLVIIIHMRYRVFFFVVFVFIFRLLNSY